MLILVGISIVIVQRTQQWEDQQVVLDKYAHFLGLPDPPPRMDSIPLPLLLLPLINNKEFMIV
jgi:hypothetical protein